MLMRKGFESLKQNWDLRYDDCPPNPEPFKILPFDNWNSSIITGNFPSIPEEDEYWYKRVKSRVSVNSSSYKSIWEAESRQK